MEIVPLKKLKQELKGLRIAGLSSMWTLYLDFLEI